MSKSNKKPYYQQVTDEIIQQLEIGNAPWVKPWKCGELSLPHNPVTGSRYRGINNIWLSVAGFSDPRWMTYKQASSMDAQVKRGEKGRVVQYWKFTEKRVVKNEDGSPVHDKNGNPEIEIIKLEKPKVFSAVVFNAEQIDGLPELEKPELTWNPHERAENIIKNSGASIKHSLGDQAFYQPLTDSIILPERSQFSNVDGYYATALHELGHWTGHSTRLNRDLSHPFGSEGYAREELRAEIASMMLSNDLAISHDPSQHTAYIANWIKILKDDPAEIFRASRDAEKIMEYTLSMEVKKEHEKTVVEKTSWSHEPVKKELKNTKTDLAREKVFLEVPYKEKDLAKQKGARWDKEAKSWYVPKGSDITPLKTWVPNKTSMIVMPGDIKELFRNACINNGFKMVDYPVMDGCIHRIKVDGDNGNERSGAYAGYLDGGTPAGFIQNWKTGEKTTWKYEGGRLTEEQKKDIRTQATENREKRFNNRIKEQVEVAKKCSHEWEKLAVAKDDHPYLKKKKINVNGLKQDKKGNLVVPLQDVDKKIWSLQKIDSKGEKRFIRGGRKQGCFHLLGNICSGKEIIIAEGLATAASIHMATCRPVAVAFDAGNLGAVTQSLKKAYPENHLVIAGDDDSHKEKNIGAEKAREASRSVDGTVILPVFTPEEKSRGLSDFNDLYCSRGKDTVKRQINKVLHQERVLNALPEKTKQSIDTCRQVSL